MNAHVEIIDVAFVLRQIQFSELEAVVALKIFEKGSKQTSTKSRVQSD